MRITWRRSFFTALLKGWATKLPFNRLQNAISIEKSDGNSTPVTRRNEVYETAKESRYEFNKFINLLILISKKCDNGLKNMVLASLNREIYWKMIETKTLKMKLISSSICKIGIMMRWIIELHRFIPKASAFQIDHVRCSCWVFFRAAVCIANFILFSSFGLFHLQIKCTSRILHVNFRWEKEFILWEKKCMQKSFVGSSSNKQWVRIHW